MFKHYIFYNPLAGGEEAVARIEEFASRYEGALLYDITKGGGYRGICEGLDPSDKVINKLRDIFGQNDVVLR